MLRRLSLFVGAILMASTVEASEPPRSVCLRTSPGANAWGEFTVVGGSTGTQAAASTPHTGSMVLVAATDLMASSDSALTAQTGTGWPLPLKLLVMEGSIALLSSSGHIAKGLRQPASKGAEALGGGLVGLGVFGGVFVPWGLASANSDEAFNGVYVFAVACGALVAAGSYNLYLANNQHPSAGRIFRDNMIVLNAVPLVTWGVARVFGWM